MVEHSARVIEIDARPETALGFRSRKRDPHRRVRACASRRWRAAAPVPSSWSTSLHASALPAWPSSAGLRRAGRWCAWCNCTRETYVCQTGARCFTFFRATLIFVDKQNITLSLPRALLRRVKRVAADRDTSVSALMAEALGRLADEDRRYSSARKQVLAALRSPRSSVHKDDERGRATSCMSAEPQREFIDTNVLVYAFDSSAAPKQQAACRLLERLWDSGAGCLSVQVLQEFFVTVTKKVASPLPVEEATARVREFTAWRVFSPTADDVLAAIGLHARLNIGFWDAMIVLAAAESACDILWTEDLSDGQVLQGVRIRNPFTRADEAGIPQ